MTSKHKNQIAIFLEDCINLSKSMVAYLNPLFDHKSAKTEWGILNETLYVSRCGYLRYLHKLSQPLEGPINFLLDGN